MSPKTTIRHLSRAVQMVINGDSCRLECRNGGNRTTAIWLTEVAEWVPSFTEWHDGQRDCTVPNYGLDD